VIGDNYVSWSPDWYYRGPENAMNTPTREDVLDVNFWAIVATCRAIINGTSSPRPWADFAETWQTAPYEPHLHRYGITAAANVSVTARRAWIRQVKASERA
jgi:hypothetical protein